MMRQRRPRLLNLRYPSLRLLRPSHVMSRKRMTTPSSQQTPSSKSFSNNTLLCSQLYSESTPQLSSLTSPIFPTGAVEEASEDEAAEDEGEEEEATTLHRLSGRRSRVTMMP